MGLYFGVILIMEKLFLLKALDRAPKWVGHLYACVLIAVGWGIFSFTDFSEMKVFFGALVGIGTQGAISAEALAWVIGFIPCLVVCGIASTPLFSGIMARLSGKRFYQPLRLVALALLLLLSVASLVSDSYNPFIYFRF